jgi:hypothetical protein
LTRLLGFVLPVGRRLKPAISCLLKLLVKAEDVPGAVFVSQCHHEIVRKAFRPRSRRRSSWPSTVLLMPAQPAEWDGGHGLRLATVNRLTSLLGLTVAVRSTLGKGFVFQWWYQNLL